MGYAGTMGAPFISGHVTDRVSSPPDFASHYLERLFILPHSFFSNDYAQTYPRLFNAAHKACVDSHCFFNPPPPPQRVDARGDACAG